MRKLYFLTLLLIGSVAFSFAQPNTGTLIDETHAVFKFRARDDMFYMKEIPENVQEFQRLHAFVNKYKSVIRNGENKVYVASYSTTIGAPRSDRALAKIMANRVKTELILQNGLKEEDFKTVNRPETYKDMNSAVVVEIWIRKKDVDPEPAPAPTPPPPAPAPKPEPTPEPAPTPTPAPVAKYSRWSIGLNAGLPFFNGDFNSITKNKVYIGWMVGLQGTYQISRTFGISLTADYAVNKTGSPKYGRNYLLSDAGDVYYVPQEGLNTRNWEELYSKISMFSAGLHVDVNVNRLFAPRRGPNKVNVILSPGAYMQTFNTKVRDKAYDDNFIGKSLSSGISFGLGGDAAMRVYLSPALDFQLKGTAIWMHENLFDNIRNLKAKDNLFWSTSIGLIWKINGSNNSDNLLYKPKQ